MPVEVKKVPIEVKKEPIGVRKEPIGRVKLLIEFQIGKDIKKLVSYYFFLGKHIKMTKNA